MWLLLFCGISLQLLLVALSSEAGFHAGGGLFGGSEDESWCS